MRIVVGEVEGEQQDLRDEEERRGLDQDLQDGQQSRGSCPVVGRAAIGCPDTPSHETGGQTRLDDGNRVESLDPLREDRVEDGGSGVNSVVETAHSVARD